MIAAAGLAVLLFPPDMGPDDTFLKVIGGVVAASAVGGGITRQDQWVEAFWPGIAEPASTDSLDAESP